MKSLLCVSLRRLSDRSSVVVVLLSLRCDAGNTSLECWLSALGVLHPGVPVMWYGHIRDLSPTAESCKGGRFPKVTRLPWLCVSIGVRQ